MTGPDMQTLLEEEELRFVPRAGRFDVDQVAARIGTLGFAFRDAALPSMHVVAPTAAMRESLRARRLAHPEDGFPQVLLIQVAPEEIHVAPALDGALAGLSAEFIAWLAATYPCQVFNEFGTDMSAALESAPEP
ncbi:MAG TPA: hypothetical protein VNE67_05565 [Acetobacteraceae bacterium]|nr:hypothetical protein [Acetobacteraceae bacterium]